MLYTISQYVPVWRKAAFSGWSDLSTVSRSVQLFARNRADRPARLAHDDLAAKVVHLDQQLGVVVVGVVLAMAV